MPANARFTDPVPGKCFKRNVLFALAGLVAASACSAPARHDAPAAESVRLINLADDFDAFANDYRTASRDARMQAFQQRIAAKFPGFYDPGRTDWLTPAQYEERVIESIEHYPEIRPRYLQLTAAFPAMMNRAVVSFMDAFPDMASIGEVYLLHSLSELDGGTRMIDGTRYLIFGADVMTLVQEFDDKQPFFHHELFHLYHARFFDDCDELWCSIWSEGLAVLVAAALNPGATEDQLLLTSPEPMVSRILENEGDVFCVLLRLATSTHTEDYQAVLGGGEAPSGLPKRFGYYGGFLLARWVQSTRHLSLGELAQMDNAEVFPLILPEIERRARCH